jgi:hypothetical protein
MPKELFNGTLLTSPTEPNDNDRISFGQPSVSSSKNIKWSYFKELIQSAGDFYGEMYFYESSGTETIGQTNQYYGINGEFGTGDLSNFTFNAGSNGSGNITTSGGTAININDVAHGLVTGDYVAVQSANHTDRVIVTKVDDDNFTVPITYVGDEACTWQQGDYLLAGTGTAGKYLLNLSITGAT